MTIILLYPQGLNFGSTEESFLQFNMRFMIHHIAQMCKTLSFYCWELSKLLNQTYLDMQARNNFGTFFHSVYCQTCVDSMGIFWTQISALVSWTEFSPQIIHLYFSSIILLKIISMLRCASFSTAECPNGGGNFFVLWRRTGFRL